ncbi:DUF4112 domain-containing protein [Phenylobacterium deserti]|uniref:AGE family epimerase/isomerase n=1 Tax=Phenylobacterium deserti TaxID=1914756 RepID=A0A328ADS0_9CAUL|nr:DUF4112 domain-containing protein [Phenylobacterium deserti]RAK52781.1 hypothetical protein DJ018_11380 [Phenylobacterium deserti]
MDQDRERAHRAWRQAERIKRLSDGLLRLGPLRLGVDGVVAWAPGAGTLYSAGAAGLLIYEALQAGASPKTVARMAAYLLADTGASSVPFVGWAIDTLFPAHLMAAKHLLETALEWQAAGGDAEWAALADELAGLALDRFIDPETGVLQEFFDAEWRPITGEAGLVEPGHHFEWAWLLERWGVSRGDTRARSAARKLFELGKRGVDTEREVAVNALWDDLSVRDATARLWPQTEYLKAALILGEEGDALMACRGLARYLDVPTRGAWRDKMRPDGSFVDEPAPASSFYHIMVALQELFGTARAAG